MLKGLFMAIMVYASKGIFYLIYGKKGMQLREKYGKENTNVGFSFLVIFWFLCALFWICGIDSAEKIMYIAVTLGVPMIITIVAVIKRKKVKVILETEANKSEV